MSAEPAGAQAREILGENEVEKQLDEGDALASITPRPSRYTTPRTALRQSNQSL
jgi:hypothetical protein